MIVVAGHLQVEPDERSSYLQGCRDVVRQARASDGCLDFALSPDLLDPGRINVLERWQTLAAVEAFRGSGPSGDQASQILDADVHRYEVTSPEPP
jgi:quinol monooxygenase YgiN